MTGFQVGDKVVCINSAPVECPHGVRQNGMNTPPEKSVRQVAIVREALTFGGGKCGCITLVLTDGSKGLASRFRKIQPCEPDFIALMNRIKPKVSQEQSA